MLDMGKILESVSPVTSPAVMDPKKDGIMRFCVDYRKHSALMAPDTYPLPRIDNMLDA